MLNEKKEKKKKKKLFFPVIKENYRYSLHY